MRWRSVRFRLTLWYLSALSLGIVLFGSLVWFEMRQQLLRNPEEGLDRRLDALGQFLGLEALDDNLAAIQEEAREYSTGMPEGHGLRLFDESGELVFERLSTASDALVRKQMITARGLRFEAELSAPLDDFYRTLGILRWVVVLSLPVVLVVAGGMGWWLAGRALKPVDAMTRAARAIQASDLSGRISEPATGDELQRSAESWNELLGRIEASVRTVTRFTADAAHELRVPLAVIRTSAELALRHERSAEQYRSTLQSVQRETEAMSELVEQLLLLAREDSGQWQFRFDAIRIGDVLRSLEMPLAAAAEARRNSLTWSLPAQEPLVWGDAEAIRRLVLILVDNALKYTPQGGTVAVRLAGMADSACIEVEDNGAGIEPQHLPHIFERFYRADPARTAGSGTGLGLSIARTITDAHHGRIEVTSQPEKGTLARVVLPVMSAQDAGVPSSAHA